MRASSVSEPTRAPGADHEAALPVDRGAGDAIPRLLRDRQRLAGEHGLVDVRAAFEHRAVDRNLFPGPHAQLVADLHLGKRNFFFFAVLQPQCRVRCQREQPPDRLAGLAHGAQLHDFADRDQRHDHRRGLEVRADLPTVHAELGGKQPRGEDRGHAVEIRQPHAQADQRIHVGAAVLERQPELVQERPAAPQHHRGREQELDIGEPELRRAQHRRHRDHRERRAERRADPEPAREVAQLGIVFCRALHGHERHAALGARARAGLHDLRVHRAGVLGARLRRRRLDFL